MKIPENKKLVDIDCFVDCDCDECLPLLDFLKKELPKGVNLEDVVLTQEYYPSDSYDPEGKDGHYELSIGYLVSKKDLEKKALKKKIVDEQEQINKLEKRLKNKKSKLNKMRKENG